MCYTKKYNNKKCKNDARILIVDKYQLTIMEQIRDLSKAPGKIIYFSNGSIDF